MAAEVAREAMGAVTLDDDSFDYMLALALDGETDAVAAFLAEPCDDDEAAAALAAEVLNALRRTGFVEPDVAEEAPAARSSDAAPLPKAPEPSAPDHDEAPAPPAKDRDEAKAATATTPPTVRPRPPSEDDGLPSDDDDEEAALQRLLDETDDFASAWTARNAEGKAWGGRGAGGRGVARRYQTMSARTKDVVVDGVTLAFLGRELLARSELRLVAGRRYALLGRNGVGKSTLLRRIAAGALPGFPPHLRIGYVAQESKAPKTADDPVTVLLASAGRRRRLAYEAERDALEDALVSAAADDGDAAAAIAERLGEVEEALEECDADLLRADATRTLTDVLGFSPKRLATPVRDLSGGWRARVALGAALLAKSDVLLLDEPTNHLDLDAVFRLEKYLLEEGANGKADAPTLFFVSHDRAFVEAVATDVVVFENCALTYFRGGLAEFEQRNEEKAANQEKRLDARVRQETAARESAERLKRTAAQKKGTNDNALRAAKQRLAKIERVGLHRDDGRRYKTNSLAKLDASFVRLPTKVEAARATREDRFAFAASEPPTGATALVSLEGVTAGYPDGPTILKGVSAQLSAGARVGLVGPNGAGKSTLLKVLAGGLTPTGDVRVRPGVRTALVAQHHSDALRPHASTSAARFLAEKRRCSELDARAVLGRFGIKGASATLPMKSLSGGQKARVSLADLTWDAPHVLLLDEPTNHLDMQALDALAAGLADFDGAVVVVSHNRAFLAACCTELWYLEAGKLDCRAGVFDELFAAYASGVLGSGGVGAAATASTGAASRARALDTASKGRKGPKAGAASNRTAML